MKQANETILTAEAARILNVTPATVRRLESAGELRATHTGSQRVRLFQRSDVERLAALRSQRQRDSGKVA